MLKQPITPRTMQRRRLCLPLPFLHSMLILRCITLLFLCIAGTESALSVDHDALISQHPHDCIVRLSGTKTHKQIGIQTTRPILEKSYSVAGGHFLIHYNESGFHGVQAIDNNNNSVPDYIDSVAYYAEYVYTKEVVELGYQAPLTDSDDSLHIDIYVMQLGKAPGASIDGSNLTGYGFTFEDYPRQSPCDSHLLRSSAFMVIDNDFAMTDSVLSSGQNPVMRRVYTETGIQGLRITLAHEFHHVIQLGYLDALHPNTFLELTSVFMEHRVFPQTQDYFQYLNTLMKNSDSYYLSSNEADQAQIGYAHAFFFQYLDEKLSDKTVLTMWKIIGDCASVPSGSNLAPNPFLALDSALKSLGTSLPEQWQKFMCYVYHTGYRAEGVGDVLSNASQMPMLVADNKNDVRFIEPFFYDVSLYPFQFKLLRCTFSTDSKHAADTVDVLFTNTGSSYLKTLTNDREIASLTISRIQKEGFKRIGMRNYYYQTTKTTSNGYDTLFLNGGVAVAQLTTPYPTPFSMSSDRFLRFPVSELIPSDARVTLSITTPDGVTALSELVNVVSDPNEKTRYVTWTQAPKLSSGVYVYSVGYETESYIGTILIEP